MMNQFHFACARYNKFRWKVLFYVGHFVADGESLSRSIGLKIESPIVNCKTDQHQQVISSKRTTLWMTYTDIHAQSPKIPISNKNYWCQVWVIRFAIKGKLIFAILLIF